MRHDASNIIMHCWYRKIKRTRRNAQNCNDNTYTNDKHSCIPEKVGIHKKWYSQKKQWNRWGLNLSDPTSNLVRHYDFHVLLRCQRHPTRFCLCARSAVRACPTLFLMYGLYPTDSAGCTLSVSQQAMCFDVNRWLCIVFAWLCLWENGRDEGCKRR